MAADYVFNPIYPYRPKIETEDTTINRLADVSELRLEQGETVGGTYQEHYSMTLTELVAVLTFWKTRRDTVTFTKLSYDALDPAFDVDNPTDPDGPTETVRFVGPPDYSFETSEEEIPVSCTFRIIRNES